MKVKITNLQLNGAIGLPESKVEEIRCDKLVIMNKQLTFEILKDERAERDYSYPSTLLSVLVIAIKDGKKTIIGFFPKIVLFQNWRLKITEIFGISRRYFERDIEAYFVVNKEKLDKIKNIDVQIISPTDALLKFEAESLKIGRELFKGVKNVK